MMTDMLGGSVNQQFCPYVKRSPAPDLRYQSSMRFKTWYLQPQDMPLTAETIRNIGEESKSHLIYVNEV